MRLSHFEHFRPSCPVCATADRRSLLELSDIVSADGHVLNGVLTCGNSFCNCEFPILDGVPVLVPDPAGYIASQYQSLVRRQDLSSSLDAMLIECQGPGNWDDAVRQHISGSAWDHWAQFDLQDAHRDRAGSIAEVLRTALICARPAANHATLDVGCALGRTTFELARATGELALGIDIHAGMITRAADILKTGRLRYDRRRCGMLYDRREFEVPIADCAQLVDFWIMNAAMPCIKPATIGCVNLFNVIDCTPSPIELLRASAGLVCTGGTINIATPFDWSPTVTPIHAWIGGHSPRGFFNGESARVLRALFTPGAHPVSIGGFEIQSEQRDIPWQVRMHDRAIMQYSLDLLIARRSG